MDICLSKTETGTFIEPQSIHGMLWLQTHFESDHWESICKGEVLIPTKDSKVLAQDAFWAGINVNFINAHAQLDKI